MDHLRQSWQKLTWREPDSFRGYPLPTGGQFAHSKQFLDPDIFDKNEKMHPWIRDPIINMLDEFWTPKYGNWREWTHVYLAGSLASYWWGTPDFDTLIGVNTNELKKEHIQFRGMSDPEICHYLTDELRQIDVSDFVFPNHILGPLDLTFYVNPGSYDIKNIKPYAAYEMLSNKWIVHPIQMDKHWNAHALDHAFWNHMADLADEIKEALTRDDITERTEDCLALYDYLHSERQKAFSPIGGGITGRGSLQWIVLNRWGLLGALEIAAHPDRPMSHIPPAIARKYK